MLLLHQPVKSVRNTQRGIRHGHYSAIAGDVPILVAARLLKPLGNPSPYNVKYFAASELLEQVQDRTWLAKVTNALNQHWQKKNAVKKTRPANGSHVGLSVTTVG